MKSAIATLLPTQAYLYLRWLDYKVTRRTSYNELQVKRLKNHPTEGGYREFDSTKSIFVHVPKCAGVSVARALYGGVAGGHTSLDQYINIFQPRSFQEYFKFCFVRNPWDRLVSAWTFLRDGGMNCEDRDFFNKELSEFSTFDDFVLQWLRPENIIKYPHFRPQLSFIVDRYSLCTVDFIGYFETLEDDFAFIRERVPGENLEITNVSNRKAYTEYYTEEARALVNKIYRHDIELLGYEFSGLVRPVRQLNMIELRSKLDRPNTTAG